MAERPDPPATSSAAALQPTANWQYQVLSRKSADIAKALAAKKLAGILASHLKARKIIGQTVYEQATNYVVGVTEFARVEHLVTAVLTKTECNPQCYHDFIEVLELDGIRPDTEAACSLLPKAMPPTATTTSSSGREAAIMAEGNQPQKRNLAAEAFKRNSTALHDALAQPDVASGLATKLYNGAIIALETRDAVQMPSFTPAQQANWLLQAVESSIKIDHTRLRKFTQVLRKQPVLKPIAKQLRQCYRELVSEARLTESSSSGSDTNSTEQHQSQAAKFPVAAATGTKHAASPGLQATKFPAAAAGTHTASSGLQGPRVQKQTLPELCNLLSPVACSWDLFAQQIGVPSDQISLIKAATPQSGPTYLYRCFIQALEWWEANHDNPVYEIMIDALDPGNGKVTPVMNRALASELREFMAIQRAAAFQMAATGTHAASPSLQGAREVSMSSSETVSLFPESTTGSVSGSDHEIFVLQGQNYTSSSFPYLDTQKLSKEEETDLYCKLLDDSDKIMDEFGDLTLRTIKSIESSGVSVKELHIYLTTIKAYKPIHKEVPLLRDQLDEIERAENVKDVFNTLHKYYSFFNYHIIEKLIGWFGTPEDKKRLETYIANFKLFCERRTFECPPDRFGAIDKGKTNLVVKVEESWGPAEGRPMETVLRLRNSLGNILGIKPSTLYLCRIDEGCMELLFQAPSFVEEDIFPLSVEQERSLTSVGVMRLTCGSYGFPQSPEARLPQTSAQAETEVKQKCTPVEQSALPRLLDILSPVVHNWRLFAELIGVPFPQISAIEAANSDLSPNYLYNSFDQSLQWWLANHHDPTYETILAVLDPKRGETTQLMNRDLAKQVKEVMAKEQGPFTMDDYTRQSIVEIQGKFENLLQTVREYLLKAMKIKDLRLFILELFPNISPDLIPNSSDLNEIFEAMRRNRLWSYMNYFSLEQIVKRFCGDNPEMTREVEKFKNDRAEFQLAVQIKAYIPAAKAYLCEHEIQEQLNFVNPDHFSKLSLTLDECVVGYSLKYLEQLWQALSFHMQLPPITLLFEMIGSGSNQIVFLIPTKLEPQVIHQAQYSAYFYEMHLIRSVTVGDTGCIYESKYAQKVSSFIMATHLQKQVIPEEEPMPEQVMPKDVPMLVQTKDLVRGYDCDVVEVPTVGLETKCHICLQIICEPHIVSCCGYRFCKSCINRIKVDGECCPLCRASSFDLTHDKKLEQSLKDLKVHCIHAESGCKWTGELRLLDEHLNVNPQSETLLEGCGFIKIKCIHCGSPCQRNLLTSHQIEECRKCSAHGGPSTMDDCTGQSIVKIQGKFGNLLQTVREYLQKKMKKNKIEDLRLFILELFPDISPDLIPNSSDLNEIFEAVRRNRLWSYMNYFSLEQIVKRFCGDKPEMTREVEKFKNDRADFLAVQIKAYIPAAKAYLCEHELQEQLNPVNPDHFSKLSLTLDECVAGYSLKYLEQLWQELSFHMQLPPITLLFEMIDSGSIQIVFLIPTKLVPQVIRQAQYSAYFYEMHHRHVRSVTVGDICIYESKYTENGSLVTMDMKQVIPEEKPMLAQTMDLEGSYDCNIVETSPAELQRNCRVCLLILREPHFVSCCGSHFCKSCINPIKVDGKSCPHCNTTTFDLTHDKQLERSLNDLKVHCTHAENGCKWIGELRQLDKHLNVNPEPETLSEGCGFIKIKCIHCGHQCQRSLLTSHQKKGCRKWTTHRGISPSIPDAIDSMKKHQSYGGHFPSLRELEQLPGVATIWYRLGLQLGVSANDLDMIERNYPRDIDMCKIKMFAEWLRGDTNPTYEKLVRALAAVGKRKLAESVCIVQGIPPSILGVTDAIMMHQSHEEMESDAVTAAKAMIGYLQNEFKQLVMMTQEAVEAKSPTLSEFRTSIILRLPGPTKLELQISLIEKLQLIYDAESIDEIFGILNLSIWSFLNFGLLQHIVEIYGDDELHQRMQKYTSSVETFRKQTTLKVFWKVHPVTRECPKIPIELRESLKRITFKHGNLDPTITTLDDINRYRQDLAREYSFPDFIIILKDIEMGCVVTIWLVPPSLSAKLEDEAKRGNVSFLERHNILYLKIQESTVYHSDIKVEGNIIHHSDWSTSASYSAGHMRELSSEG